MWLFFMIIPVIMGVLRFKELDFSYRALFYSCCLIFISQSLYFFFYISVNKLLPFWNNIFNYLSALCWLPVFVFLAISWSRIKNKYLLTIAFFLTCIISILIETYLLGLEEIRESLAILFCKLLAILFFAYVLNDLINQNILKRNKRSKLLIILPYLIMNSYSISVELFMYFLYSEETVQVFQNLYFPIMYLGALDYMCMALSIFLAPKKEVFI
jgi:hypothetical protein